MFQIIRMDQHGIKSATEKYVVVLQVLGDPEIIDDNQEVLHPGTGKVNFPQYIKPPPALKNMLRQVYWTFLQENVSHLVVMRVIRLCQTLMMRGQATPILSNQSGTAAHQSALWNLS